MHRDDIDPRLLDTLSMDQALRAIGSLSVASATLGGSARDGILRVIKNTADEALKALVSEDHRRLARDLHDAARMKTEAVELGKSLLQFSNHYYDWVGDVMAFHRKFGCATYIEPGAPPPNVQELRKKLMREELNETEVAMEAGNLEGVADGLADLIYVAIGTALAYGIDLRPVWNEVQRANMAKEGGGRREDGKILKPEGWVAPDIKTALTEGRLDECP